MGGRFKESEWDKNGDQVVHTGHKTFDRQTNCIMPGNILAPTMTGWHIRAHSDVDSYRPVKPGYLQEYDLEIFKQELGRYPLILDHVRRVLKDQPGWFYRFFHYRKGKRINHGYVLTTKDHRHICTWIVGRQFMRSFNIVYECKKYICVQEDDDGSS